MDFPTIYTNLFFPDFFPINVSHLYLLTMNTNLFFPDFSPINVSHLDFQTNNTNLFFPDFSLINVSHLDLMTTNANLFFLDLSNPIIHTSRHLIRNSGLDILVSFLNSIVLYSIQKIFLINFYDICNI